MLFRMSAEAETRRLTIIGVAVMSCLAVAFVLIVINPFGDRMADRISIVMAMPYVGQGVTPGTAMMMHGVNVGEVTSVSSLPTGGVELRAYLQSGPAAGLTDTLSLDFRPANYFGVTGVNLVPGPGGQALRDGAKIDTVPRGNFTLPTMLSRLGEITDGVVTPQLIHVIERATRYTDVLNPLIETMVITANALTKVQTVSTEQLLRTTTGVTVVMPSFVATLADVGDNFTRRSCMSTFTEKCLKGVPNVPPEFTPGSDIPEEFWRTRAIPTLDYVSASFFAAIGKLESSHTEDLLPAVGLVQTLTDVIPGLVTPENVGSSLVELRTRLEKLYAGSPDQRALQVHIVLDNLPGVAAPISAMGGP